MTPKTTDRHYRLGSRLMRIAALTVLVLAAIHLAGVAALRHVVETQLHPALPKGTEIERVHLNLFRGAVEVEGFSLKNDGVERMRAERLIADVNELGLLMGRVEIERLVLDGGYLLVERRPDGSFDLGVEFPDDASDAGPSEGPAPDISLDRLQVDGLRIDFRDGDQQSVLDIGTLTVGRYALRSQDQETPIAVDLVWDEVPITAELTVSMQAGQLAANGVLVTGLIDLARVQRLARLKPEAIGQVGFDGDVGWNGTTASVQGAAKAPRLKYRIGGRDIEMSGLDARAIRLELAFDPALSVDFVTDQPMTADSYSWSVDGQGATGERVTLQGKVTIRGGGAGSVEDLRIAAQTIGWDEAGRKLDLRSVELSGRMAQDLTGDALLPAMVLDVDAETLEYADANADLAMQVAGLRAQELTLSDEGGGPRRGLAAQLTTGRIGIEQQATTIVVAGASAQISGAVSIDEYQVAADAGVDELSLVLPALPHGPLELAEIRLSGLALSEQIGAESLRLRGLELPGGLDETGLTVGEIDIQRPEFDPAANRLSVERFAIDGLQTGVIRDEAATWQHVMTHANASNGPQDTGEASDPGQAGLPEQQPLSWQLGAVTVSGDSHVTVSDRLNPDMQPLRYTVEKLEVGALASDTADSDTPFALAVRPDRFSEFVISGKLRPLDQRPFLDAAGHLHGFGLTTVNGLVANDLGHRFLDGQFDIDFEIKIADSQLEMSNQLALSGVEVEEIPGKDGPPIGTAIALLEDRDGNIKLEVPIEGDLTDPDFRVLGALDPIIAKSVAGAAALAIQPLGSVLLVGSLVADQALKVTFDPAPFEPGDTALNDRARDYLEQLAEKLNEKPKLALRVCGIYAAQERSRDKEGKFTDDPEQLLVLAQQRADTAKAYMRELGVNAKQLRRCRPSLDASEEGLPRVDIRF